MNNIDYVTAIVRIQVFENKGLNILYILVQAILKTKLNVHN